MEKSELQTNAKYVKDLGPVFQTACVEANFEKAVSHCNPLGVGPFFVADNMRKMRSSACLRIVQEMNTASADVLYAQVNSDAAHYIEFAKFAPRSRPLFDSIKRTCATWYAVNPILSLSEFI